MTEESWFIEKAKGFGMALKITKKIHDEKSPYQHIEVFETETFGRLLTLDGLTMLTSRDNFIYHEMMSHPALFIHSNPKHVVIVGGGDCGTLREVLKHREVEKAMQVELDERVTRVTEEFFPELCDSNGDERAQFMFVDAIQWMADAPQSSIDVILLDTTDPVGQASRLFSAAFYRDCLRALREGGVMVAQSESPLFDMGTITSIHKAMHAAGASDIKTIHFPQCTYPSGWWSATLARKGQKLNGFRETAARKKAFPTRYYNADIHIACQLLPVFMHETLAGIAKA